MANISWYYNQQKAQREDYFSCTIPDIQLRFLRSSDVEEVWELCNDCFPIDYPFSWYKDITSNPKFYSLGALFCNKIIGLLVAELKPYRKLSAEDKNIVAPCYGDNTEVGYILSLAVDERYRRNGVGSMLLDTFINHLTSTGYSNCKAIFLHVLTTNTAAINFYEHRNFRLHMFLPYYYFIRGRCKDGFTYVLYINGGHPTNGFIDFVRCCLSTASKSSVIVWTRKKMQLVSQWMLFKMKRLISVEVTGTEMCAMST